MAALIHGNSFLTQPSFLPLLNASHQPQCNSSFPLGTGEGSKFRDKKPEVYLGARSLLYGMLSSFLRVLSIFQVPYARSSDLIFWQQFEDVSNIARG